MRMSMKMSIDMHLHMRVYMHMLMFGDCDTFRWIHLVGIRTLSFKELAVSQDELTGPGDVKAL